MQRFIGPLVLCTFMPAWTSAQVAVEAHAPPSLAGVQASLRSGSPSDVAWGAFLAAQFQLRDAIPTLVERLQSPPDADGNRRHHLIAAVLDSLIQLDARLPASTLLPYYTDWPIHTLVLLGSANEGRDLALLNVLRAARGDHWFAAANLLLATKPAGLAAVLLSGASG